MRAKLQAECALTLLSGALFHNANKDVLTQLFPNNDVIFTKDSTFAKTAIENVTWYWVDDDTHKPMTVNANSVYPMIKNMEKLFRKGGKSLAGYSFAKDSANVKNKLLVVINKYKE